ncbi:MAG: hypothetical protein LBQ80_04390 [Clostridium sp.]|jgi:hypothetical protein|nr:hypothetical protein [Clostridium sp.]
MKRLSLIALTLPLCALLLLSVVLVVPVVSIVSQEESSEAVVVDVAYVAATSVPATVAQSTTSLNAGAYDNVTGISWAVQHDFDIFEEPLKYDKVLRSPYDKTKEQIIVPGTTGDYVFTVRNEEVVELDYTLKIWDENKWSVPMEYRLLRGGKYITGNENTWVGIEELARYEYSIPGKSEQLYTLQWRWKFDESTPRDVADTHLGSISQLAATAPRYRLSMSIIMEYDGDLSNINTKPDTGDSLFGNMLLWGGVGALAFCGLLVLLVVSRRRKEEEQA